MELGRPDRSQRLDAIAAEYALGTLSPRARRRVDSLIRRDARVANAVHGWEYRLAGLAEGVPAVTPAPRVWEGIRQRLGMAEEPRRGREPWWANIAIWRGLATAGFAIAVGLGVLLATLRPGEPQPVIVVLAGQDARPALVASAARGSRTLIVKAVATVDVAPDRSLELWALPEGQNPQPLGLVPATGVGRITLAGPAESVLANARALAVSLEPAGGSPTGLPTGPVLYTGAVQRMY
jgi:anti-sigma-K factor RskA